MPWCFVAAVSYSCFGCLLHKACTTLGFGCIPRAADSGASPAQGKLITWVYGGLLSVLHRSWRRTGPVRSSYKRMYACTSSPLPKPDLCIPLKIAWGPRRVYALGLFVCCGCPGPGCVGLTKTPPPHHSSQCASAVPVLVSTHRYHHTREIFAFLNCTVLVDLRLIMCLGIHIPRVYNICPGPGYLLHDLLWAYTQGRLITPPRPRAGSIL